MKPRKKQIVTTGGAGYIPSQQIDPYRLAIDVISGGLPADTIRNRLYRNLRPVGYESSILDNIKRFRNAVKYNRVENDGDSYDGARDDLWAQYLGIPENNRRSTYKIHVSPYKPSINSENGQYYALDLAQIEKDFIVKDAMQYSMMPESFKDTGRPNYLKFKELPPLNRNQNKLSNALNMQLGTHTIGRGTDKKKGDYVSYYDKWDIAPVGWYGPDQSGGIGKPVNIYDRIYLDDYYGVDSSASPGTYYGGYLPEVIVKPRQK